VKLVIANRAYAYDLEVPKKKEEEYESKKEFKLIKFPAIKNIVGKAQGIKTKPKSRLSLVLSVVAIFTMLIVLSYRFNVISEKNLELQRLNIESGKVKAMLATTQIEVDQIIDKDTVESYAKRQLGMQKPEKSQLVYINSNYETKVESVNEGNIISKVVDKLKDIIGIK
jgi:cell division protein FtsL